MLSERTLHDPAVYMRLRGYPETVIIECAVCPRQFAVKDGVAFPAVSKTGEPIVAAFCCFACYLGAMPPEKLWRA
jgi:hypothetical protein